MQNYNEMATRLFLTILFLTASVNLKAQTKKDLAFKKLILVTYELNKGGKGVSIQNYLEIDNGVVHQISKLYKGISDTTYLLPDSMVTRLNAVFNGRAPLKSYLKVKKLPPGHFGGEPYFFSYTDNKGLTENLIVVDIYMTNEFMKSFGLLSYLPSAYGSVKYKGDKVKYPEMEAIVLKYNNACTYLPSMESPPPAKM